MNKHAHFCHWPNRPASNNVDSMQSAEYLALRLGYACMTCLDGLLVVSNFMLVMCDWFRL